MEPKSDLLHVALNWIGTRGLLGLFLGAFTTLLRALLGFDSTRRELALSFTAALFVIGFVAPRIPELLALRPKGSSMIGAVLGLTARPLIEALMQLARRLRQDAFPSCAPGSSTLGLRWHINSATASRVLSTRRNSPQELDVTDQRPWTGSL